MKKIFTLLAVAALSVSFASAQNARRAVGDMSLDLGVGFPTAHSDMSIALPPIDANFEYTILDFGNAGTLSVGGVIAFQSLKSKYDYSMTSILVAPQATYRFPIMDNLDLFGKLALGYLSTKASDARYGEFLNSSGFGWAGYAGATYYFSEKLGVGAQIGNGLSLVELHVTIKL